MDIVLSILIALALLVLLFLLLIRKGKKKPAIQPVPASYRELLSQGVPFYQQLDETQQELFANRVQHFIASTRITGVNTVVEEIDKVYVAASAVIPTFGFPDWEYININEVLLYPDSFNHDFEQQGTDRSILGMVGTGAYEDVMILSQHELRQGFINKTGKSNTAIHEFVHLVDKTDGSTDGIPEFALQHNYVLPWLDLVHKKMKQILANRSDIDPYGATNQAEFFAVVAEYFFERPDLLKEKHPDLYEVLSSIFRQQPAGNKK